MSEKIFVTKSFQPPIEIYQHYIEKIFQGNQFTNQGPMVCELELQLKRFLNVQNCHYVTNGTIALQLALRALDITEGEIITTPFSYVATTSSILWERCTPVFVDIEPINFTIDVEQIESAITSETKAILAVHVFGYPCNIEKIEAIAQKHHLKVIYDAAHTFGCQYKGRALVDYGDVSTLSFHSTKLFHTIEGGACIVKNKDISDHLELMKRFGHTSDHHFCLGINAKQSEFHAAMGLANFPYIETIIAERKKISELYDSFLSGVLQRPEVVPELNYNYAYYPVVFDNEESLLDIFSALNQEEIFPRRYFYPSLNQLPYIEKKYPCKNSEDISLRIACLPLYVGLEEKDVERISRLILKVVKNKDK